MRGVGEPGLGSVTTVMRDELRVTLRHVQRHELYINESVWQLQRTSLITKCFESKR